MTLAELPETRLVEALIRLLPDAGALVGPGDDAAVVRVGAERIVLSVDCQRQGVHFRPEWISPSALGARALQVALSDLAAMAAEPLCSLVALGAPGDLEQEWLEGFTRGLSASAADSGCPVVGGDVSRSPSFVAEVTVVGCLPAGRQPIRRSGARAGDELWVSGCPGLAAAGRALLERGEAACAPGREDAERALAAWRRPLARLRLARELAVAGAARAAIDVSDGVALDLARLCRASGTGAVVEAEALVCGSLARLAQGPDEALAWALAGGEDYELLFAAPPAARSAVAACGTAAGVGLRRVGRLLAVEEGYQLIVRGERVPLVPSGFEHFGMR